MPRLSFYNIQNKYVLDSVKTLKNSLPIIGRKTPSFKLTDIKGDSISLSNFEGKAVIINFWASWCAPCLKEFPHENLLYSQYESKGLIFVDICVDTKRKKWESLSVDRNLKMVNLFTTEKEYVRLKLLYNIQGLPRTILVGKDQNILKNNYKRASEIKDVEILQLLASKG